MSVTTEKPAGATAIRPFHVEVPEEELADLRRRIAATRWPEPETVPDQSQGVQLSRLQGLLRYWGTDYDWRRAEARLNALPQFITEIDGLDIHFLHVRSRHPGCSAADRDPRLARVGPRAAEGDRAADRPDGARRNGRGGVPSRHPVAARLRLLGPAEGGRLEPGPDRSRLGRADDAPGVLQLRRTGRGLGRGHYRGDGTARAARAARHPRQPAGGGAARRRSGAGRRRDRCRPCRIRSGPFSTG